MGSYRRDALILVGLSTGTVSATPAAATAQGLVPGVSGGSVGDNWYVSTSGSPTAAGSIGAPWDIATALSGGYPANAVGPGDTIWIRGGTYTRPAGGSGTFSINLTGEAANPIKIKAYTGESVVFSGGTGVANYIPAIFSCDAGGYYWFQGPRIEVRGTTNFKRTSAYSGQDYSIDCLGCGGFVTHSGGHAVGVRLINLVIHDTMGSIGAFSQFESLEVSDCLLYFDGVDAPDRSHGHAIYSATDKATYPNASHVFLNNIIHNTFNDGLNCYGTVARIDSHLLDGNISFNNGGPSARGEGRNFTFATGGGAAQAPVTNVTVRNNCGYHRTGLEVTSANMFQSVAAYDQAAFSGLSVTDNRFYAGDSAGCYFTGVQSDTTLTGNKFKHTMTHTSDNDITPANYPSNTQYESNPTANEVIVIPNIYESKWAHVAIYNWEGLNTVAVDLSTVLSVSDSYVIKSAENYFGTPIASGTYDGDDVMIPMTGHTLATLLGTNLPTPYFGGSCAPTFAALIVEGATGGGRYASTTGSATGAGTIDDPWTLTVALAGGYPTNTVQPGETVWIRGGTYTGSFSPTRAGSAGNPITYRAYPGERATIDCNGGSGINGYIFSFGAPYVRIQDMEIIDSDWIDNWAPAGIGGDPVSSGAPHLGCEVINCIIHDTGSSGLDTYSDALNGFLAYGNVVYFVGGTMGVNGQAYCVYGNNAAAHNTKLFENNAFLFQWGTYPMHIYTQAGEIQHFTFKKNATLVAGDLKGDGRNWNFFGSGSKTLTDFLLDDNCIFGDAFSDITDQGLFDFGVDGISSPYGALNGVTVTNNLMGAGTMAISTNRSNFSMSSNTMWGSAYFGWTYGAGGTFPSNTFYSSRPAANWTKVYPNAYETGRAMLVCFNWASAGSQNFDFSSFLAEGDDYEVRDAFNFYGTAITSGTYAGGNVSITLAANPTIATTLKVPTGYSQPQHPAPDYYVFIVRKT